MLDILASNTYLRQSRGLRSVRRPSPREAHPCNPARSCYAGDGMSNERKLNTGRRRQAVKLRSHPQNYALQRRPIPFFQRRIAAFSPASHSTHSDERKHIQVSQNKHSVSRSLDTLVKARCSNFRTRIQRLNALRGSTHHVVILRSAATRDLLLSQGKEHPRLQDSVRAAF